MSIATVFKQEHQNLWSYGSVLATIYGLWSHLIERIRTEFLESGLRIDGVGGSGELVRHNLHHFLHCLRGCRQSIRCSGSLWKHGKLIQKIKINKNGLMWDLGGLCCGSVKYLANCYVLVPPPQYSHGHSRRTLHSREGRGFSHSRPYHTMPCHARQRSKGKKTVEIKKTRSD